MHSANSRCLDRRGSGHTELRSGPDYITAVSAEQTVRLLNHEEQSLTAYDAHIPSKVDCMAMCC